MKTASNSIYKQMATDAKAAKAAIIASSDGKGTEVNVAMPGATLKGAMTAIPTGMVLHKGIPALRMTSRGVWKHRVITLSSDKLAFFITHQEIPTSLQSQVASALPIPFWTPSKGFQWSNDEQRYIRHIDIADIDAWQVGVIGTMSLETSKTIQEKHIQEIVTIFHHGLKTISFRITNEEHRKALVQALSQMKDCYHIIVPWIANEQLLLRYIQYDIDVDKSGTISSTEFADICKRINLEIPNRDKLFKDFAKKSTASKKRNELTSAETRQLLQSISFKDMPAAKLWDQIFGENTDSVGPGQFREDFLLQTQGEMNTSAEDVELLVQSLKIYGCSKDTKTISKAEFVEFLHSKYNDAYDPVSVLPSTTKLDQPLSYYWINTSHNTYLTGDQLQSRSSVEAYVKALFRGCKCLEVDCWDGQEENRASPTYSPVVYHGHTITTKITFKSICLVVNTYLQDTPSSLPIILSLENHCSHPYQKTMAKDMKEIFGKKLFIPTKQQTTGNNLPSPEELRGMVVIKGKRPPEPDEEDATLLGKDGNKNLRATSSPETNGDEDVDQYDEALKTPKKSQIDPELARLTLFHGTKYKDFNTSITQPPSHMHSIGETKIVKILDKTKNNGNLWRKYNIQHMTRTYPAGARVDSSNYNPVLAWSMGCQLVALNFQTSDTPLLLNDGLYRQLGSCGYLLKPASIMSGSVPKPKAIKVSILSAHCLPKPMGAKAGELVDPYIQVDLHDVLATDSGKEKYVNQTFKTSSVDNNGFCPSWKDANTTFEVCNPDVAILLFKIIDDDYNFDDFIASSAIPIACLRRGYRSVQLYDKNDTRTGPFESATLFVKIDY